MRILLTGAGGFTGQPFAEMAMAGGHEVVPLRADLTDAEALATEVKAARPQAVVHLAAISFVGHTHEDAFYAVNAVGTTNLLDALAQLETPPRIVLLASSANVYGNTEQSPIVETQPPAPVNHYAMSKLAMELMARTYMDRLSIVITRPFNYTGPGQDPNFVVPKLAAHFARGLPTIALGNLQVEREFNDVHMVCHAYLQLLEHGVAGETYNVCSGQPYRLQEVIDIFSRLSGRSVQVSVNPSLVRPNEVHRLCGSPEKLNALLRSKGVDPVHTNLPALIQRMLDGTSAAPG
ncbi:GDP-mannose 4,6-dehydratase [Variovorax sp. LARHSF232]